MVQNDDVQLTWLRIVHSRDGVPRQQPHCRSGLATLPSVGAVP